MLGKFKFRLENLLAPENASVDVDHSKAASSAAAALLIEAALADSDLSSDELKQIETTLSDQFGIDVDEVEQTLENARRTLKSATCLHEITNIINRSWDLRQKIHLVESMWKVVLSDDYLDPHENHLMRKIKGLLHIPHAEYISAKLRARKALERQ